MKVHILRNEGIVLLEAWKEELHGAFGKDAPLRHLAKRTLCNGQNNFDPFLGGQGVGGEIFGILDDAQALPWHTALSAAKPVDHPLAGCKDSHRPKVMAQ